jgi:hypothetical protein
MFLFCFTKTHLYHQAAYILGWLELRQFSPGFCY